MPAQPAVPRPRRRVRSTLGARRVRGQQYGAPGSDRDSARFLVKFSWTPIVRHTLVKGRSSPDDPALAEYWATRRRRRKAPLGPSLKRLLGAQKRTLPACGDLFLHAHQEPQSHDEWKRWLIAPRKAIRRTAIAAPNSPTDDNARYLMHTFCARRHDAAARKTARLPAYDTIGLA